MTPSRQEMQWVLRAQCEDREALECLLREIQPSLRRYLVGVVGSSDADDLMQDVLIVICRKLVWLREPGLFRPWMFRIASRLAFRHLKRERRRLEHTDNPHALEQAPANAPPPPPDMLEELLASGRTSPASRAVLVLHFQEEMPLNDVAAILEIPLGTVKSRLAYGLATLRRSLEEKGQSNDRIR